MTCSNSKLRVCTHYSRWKAVVYFINAKCRKRASQSFTDNCNTEWGEVGIWIPHHVKVWKKASLFVCCEKYWNGFYWYHPQLFVNGNMKNVEPSEPDCLVETKLKKTALHCTLSKLFLRSMSVLKQYPHSYMYTERVTGLCTCSSCPYWPWRTPSDTILMYLL